MPGGPDWAGFVIFTAALASLVYGPIESNQRSFTDGLVLGCLVAAAVLLALFIMPLRSRSRGWAHGMRCGPALRQR